MASNLYPVAGTVSGAEDSRTCCAALDATMSLPAGMQEDHVVTIRDTERPEMKEEFSRSSESPSASFESTGGDDRKGVLAGVQSLEWNVDSYVVGRADKQKTILRNISEYLA